ncbi:MAG: FHA domain-containing protein [Deltaproteobacteria bacterium]|jgi:hypothetical protein|nr:FHA domain-containing protein [Deltaproteobacteria bacterium]
MANEDKYREKLGLSGESQKNVTLRARNKTILLNSNMTSQLRGMAGNNTPDNVTSGVIQPNLGATSDTSWGNQVETPVNTGNASSASGWERMNVASSANSFSTVPEQPVVKGEVTPADNAINSVNSWNRSISGSSQVSRSLDKLVENDIRQGADNNLSQNFSPVEQFSNNEDWGTETIRTIKQSDFDWDKIDAEFDAAEKRQSSPQAGRDMYNNNEVSTSINNEQEERQDQRASQAPERDYGSGSYNRQINKQWEEPAEPIVQAGFSRTVRNNDAYNDTFNRESSGAEVNMSNVRNQNNVTNNYYTRNAEMKTSQPASQRFNNSQNFNIKSKEEKMPMDNTRQGFSFNPKNTASEKAVLNSNSGIRPVPRQRKGRIIAFLISFDVDPNGEVYEISAGRWLVTSKPTEHTDYILLEEDTVSPLHAFIRATENGRIQVLDQLSEYGTFVTAPNSEEEEEIAGAMAALEHGSRVRFGNRRFVLAIVPPIA